MMKVYFSCITTKPWYSEALDIYKTLNKELSTYDIKVRFPFLQDDINDEYFYSDIMELEKSDIFVINMPKPSIGASCELAIFKTIKFFKPAIGFKCINHGWLNKLLDYRTNDIDILVKYILNIYNFL